MQLEQHHDEDQNALEEARVCVDLANAMLQARGNDPVQAARGLLVLAYVLVNQSPAGRTTIAVEALRLARECDANVFRYAWQ